MGRSRRPENISLRDHTGVIVRRNNPDWPGPQAICQAARLGRYIVTAEHCIPDDIKAKAHLGDYLPDLGFRFFDNPAIYGVNLRRLGTNKDPNEDQPHDYAVFEISDAHVLREDIEPFLERCARSRIS